MRNEEVQNETFRKEIKDEICFAWFLIKEKILFRLYNLLQIINTKKEEYDNKIL